MLPLLYLEREATQSMPLAALDSDVVEIEKKCGQSRVQRARSAPFYDDGITSLELKRLARECGFDLAGITPAAPVADYERFNRWRNSGFAGEMSYLTDRRGDLRSDPRHLLISAQSILCVGKLYTAPHQPSTGDPFIARYASGDDYHDVLRAGLECLAARLKHSVSEPFEYRICVDTAPLLERSLARLAGLGWIGRNTCLINQEQGSYFLLAELLLSLSLEPDTPPADRCGTCRRCIDACPTAALVPGADGQVHLDSRLCISYLTIEKRGEISAELEPAIGRHVFGCDICQDVCPWNRRASSAASTPTYAEPPLEELANLSASEFRQRYRKTAVWRSKYAGFLRNVAIAMGNSTTVGTFEALQRLVHHEDETVASAAARALARRIDLKAQNAAD